MGQLGFFDTEKRLAALSAKGDPLEAIDRLVPWESFRADIEAVVLTPDEVKKSSAGRKPVDAIVMFRMLVLQALHNLLDEEAEYQVRDRYSFTRFLRLGIEDGIPDATTLWLFREKLAKASLIEKLFERFDQHLAAQGYMARGGQMVDATIVPVPKQRNSGDENETVKAGETPAEWEKKPAKLRQKDRDARWTKKHGKSFFGYKNHVNADAKHKLIRRYEVTDAAVHDSQPLDALLTKDNTSTDVFADSAYRSVETEAKLKAGGFRSRIHRRGRRGQTPTSCRGHPVQRREAAHVIDEVLQADLGACPDDADRAHDPAADRTLLRSEHVLDARADSALGAVRSRLRIRQRMVAVGAPMNAAAKAAGLELCLGLGRAIGAVGENI